MAKLKPCPFCGETPTKINQFGWESETYITATGKLKQSKWKPCYIVGHNCRRMAGNSEKEATAAWNRRPDV